MRQRSRVTTRTTATMASAAMLAAGLIALAPEAAQAAPGSKTFSIADGNNQAWIVPADVHSLNVKVNGAAGGAGGLEGGSGGRGASGTVTVPVTPGQQITVYLGGRGGDAHTDNPGIEGIGGGSGGPAKGGAGGEAAPFGGAGGGGGGATEVFVGTPSDANRAIVAGGGGGGGGNNGPNLAGGNGGGADHDGQNGTLPESEGGHPGDAATQAGGVGDSANGFLSGGGAGGGGGGFQGGSQGATFLSSSGAGGGGGRSYVNPLLGELQGSWNDTVEGNGSVVVTFNSQYTTGVTITDPGVVVTGQMKGYKVSVGATAPGQLPTGAVELTAENLANGVVTALGTKNLVNGTTTIYSDKLKVGNYTLHANYTPNGASDSLPSSADLDFSVIKGDTSTMIAGPLDPPNFGDVVDLGVSVTPVDPAGGIPTGTVKFTSNGIVLGAPVVLDGNGHAVLSTNKLPVGTHDIIATYSGDKEFNGSVDETSLANFTVNQGDVSVELTSVHNPVIAGEKSKFDVTVTSNKPNAVKPTGTVKFYIDQDAISGDLPVDYAGKVHYELELPVTNPDAHHHVTAVYSGDDNYHTATSNYVDQIVNFGSAKVALSSDLNPSHAGNDVTFSIDVSGNLPTQPYEPTGQVQLYVNGSAFNGPVDIDADGKAQITTDDLPVGDNHVTARYLGDKRYKEAESGELIQVVKKQLVAVTLVANGGNPTSIQYGQNLTLSAHAATEKGDLATGFITFYDDGVQVGAPIPVDGNGNAHISSDKASKGVHQYSAVYSGDGKTEDGVSNTVQVTVKKNVITIKLVTSHIPAYEGQTILVHARVFNAPGSLGKIAGTVQYYSDDKKIGGPVLVSGTYWGSRTIKNVKAGTHRIVARFTPKAGQSPYEATTSTGLIQRVLKGKPNATVKMTVKRTGVDTGTVKITVRSKASGAGLGGWVRVYVDGTPVKLLKLSGGATSTYVLTGLPDRSVFVGANYLGSGKYKQATYTASLLKF
ncbi:Ig-like domain-containing protein [Aeromicrobium sp. Root236]|uniref:Ig-like domain-containing protein n=1 Tax=Aeromicrobium sp. Root236 TaxID=1736498 RepID=UPI0012F8D89F|nr:Ig-like domain-containing protein [Aeromicrobium sp. Root236]